MLLLPHLTMSVWQNLPEEVGWCLPPSACLLTCLVRSGPFWSNACRQPAICFFCCFFSSLFLSFLFLSHDRHGWTIPLPLFSSVFYPTSSLCVPFLQPPTPQLLLMINIWSSSSFSWDPSDTECLCTFISV